MMRTTTAVTAILMLSLASGAGDTLRDRVIAMQRPAQEPSPRAVPRRRPPLAVHTNGDRGSAHTGADDTEGDLHAAAVTLPVALAMH